MLTPAGETVGIDGNHWAIRKPLILQTICFIRQPEIQRLPKFRRAKKNGRARMSVVVKRRREERLRGLEPIAIDAKLSDF